MKDNISLSTKILISGILVFLILLLTSGFLGLYSIKTSMKDSQYFIGAEISALKIQTIFQKQFHLWKNIILEGDDFMMYKKNYHEYSQVSDMVQDALFNLKLACLEIEGIQEKIEALRLLHSEISRDYLTYLLKLNKSDFKNKNEILMLSQEKAREALSKMNIIVRNINNASRNEIKNINEYYYNLIFLTLILLSLLGLVCGFFVSKKILSAHYELERKVSARTKELEELNDKLIEEIEERKRTEELLRKAKKETEEVNRKITLSEKKYRMLVDESNDIIFSLNDDLMIISANRALSRLLRINPEKVDSIYFLDLIHEENNGRGVAKQLVKEKIDNFLMERKPVKFIASFISGFLNEPREMTIKLEYLNIEGRNEIHGIASIVVEDSLLKYFIYERQKFAINNYLLTAEEATQRMAHNLHRYLSNDNVIMIRIALREILINAIEHGNLEISYNEKTKSLTEDYYLQLLEERRKRPAFSKRLVYIEYHINSERAEFKITDQGNGFDYRKILNTDTEELLYNEGEQHGRGIAMAREIFDSIKYNRKGNSVLLIKELGNN